MNEITIPQEATDLDKAILLSKFVHKAVPALRSAIYKVFKSNEWEGRFSSWGEFVESEEGLGLSQSGVSKMLKVEEYYVLKAGIAPEALNIDNEKLYLATRLPGEAQENLVKAQTLTRSDLKAILRDEPNEGCFEHQWITICSSCDLRKND